MRQKDAAADGEQPINGGNRYVEHQRRVERVAPEIANSRTSVCEIAKLPKEIRNPGDVED